MRKAILSVVLALALAGVASALPTLGGGTATIYFDYQVAGVGQIVQTMTLNSDWSAATGLTALATVVNTNKTAGRADGDAYGVGMTSAWGSNSVLIGENQGNLGDDLLSVGASTTTLHLGSVDPYKTWVMHSQITVDSGFTPNGETKGIYTTNLDAAPPNHWGYFDTVWTESAPGVFDTANALPVMNVGGQDSILAYSRTGGTVNGQAVTGVAMMVSSSTNGGIKLVYKLAAGGYVRVDSVLPGAGAAPGAGGVGTGYWPLSSIAMLGDTNGDGRAEGYWTSNNGIAIGTDVDGDGKFDSAGEAAMSGVPTHFMWGACIAGDTATLVKGADGTWAIVAYNLPSVSPAFASTVTVYPLNAAGLYVGGSYEVATGLVGPVGGKAPTITVIQGSSGPIVPEPATMLLLGTGVLGLAGVIRRRLIG